MAFEETTVGGAVLVKADGRIDMSNADAFKDALVSAVSTARRAVIVDMAGVDYISSAGLRALTIALRSAKDAGKGFAVAALTPLVLEIFTISRGHDRLSRCTAPFQEALRRRQVAEEQGGKQSMRITFWGTRGSLPAPLGGGAVRRKLVNALVKAAGADLDTPEKAEAFCDTALSFPEQSTFGGNTSCVQVDAGCFGNLHTDLGFPACGNSRGSTRRHEPGTARRPESYWSPRTWEPHHRLPVLRAGVHPEQQNPHLQRHPALRAGHSQPEPRAVLYRWSSRPRRRRSSSSPWSRKTLRRDRRLHRHRHIAACTAEESFGYRVVGGSKTAITRADAEYKPEGVGPHGAHRGVLQGHGRGDLRFHVFAGWANPSR